MLASLERVNLADRMDEQVKKIEQVMALCEDVCNGVKSTEEAYREAYGAVR